MKKTIIRSTTLRDGHIINLMKDNMGCYIEAIPVFDEFNTKRLRIKEEISKRIQTADNPIEEMYSIMFP